MLPFINRKHPVLKIVEIECKKSERIKGGIFEFIPLSAEGTTSIMGLGVSFLPIDDFSFSFEEDGCHPKFCFLPVGVYFETSPSLEDLSNQLTGERLPNSSSSNIIVFSPLGADSQLIQQNESHTIEEEFQRRLENENLLFQRIIKICQSTSSLGVLQTVRIYFSCILSFCLKLFFFL